MITKTGPFNELHHWFCDYVTQTWHQKLIFCQMPVKTTTHSNHAMLEALVLTCMLFCFCSNLYMNIRRANSKENICQSSLNMNRTDKSHVSRNYKWGYQQYGSCMLILENAGSEQAKQTLWTNLQCNLQCICVSLHPRCHHPTKPCRLNTCWNRPAAKTLCNLSNLPPMFKSEEPCICDVFLAAVWCINYFETQQAVHWHLENDI